jgi:autotransporter-associated beta strand protein
VAGNWTNGVPDSAGSIALFGNQTLSGPATVTLDGSETVGRITFSDPNSYTIAAGSGGKLTIDDTGGSGGANPSINSSTGTHFISANVTLANGVTILGAGNLGISGNIDGSGGLTVAGPGSTTLSGINTYSGTTNVSGGTLSVNNLASLPSGGNLTVTGVANIAAVNGSGLQHLTLGNVTVNGNGAIKLGTATLHTDRTVVAASLLSIAGATNSWTGSLDLGGNDLVLASGNLTTITNQLKQGYNNGNWNGAGISSLAAASDTRHLTAIGVMQETATGTFDGVGVTAGSIVLKYTYYGDANLDGKVDGTDYSRIDAAYLADQSNPGSMTGWYNGDFNYDGVINGSDYTLIDNAYNTQGAQLSAELASPTAQVAAGGSSAVPEPTTLGLLATAVAGMLGRRRRRM